MADGLAAYLAKGVFERAKSSGADLGFVYDGKRFPMDIRFWGGVYIGFFEKDEKNIRKVHILVHDNSIGEKARDTLMWLDNYVENGSVSEGEFRLKIEEDDKRVVNYVKVTRGNEGFLEVALNGKPSNEKVFDIVFKRAIAPLISAIRSVTRGE